jgi:hypothetical protein
MRVSIGLRCAGGRLGRRNMFDLMGREKEGIGGGEWGGAWDIADLCFGRDSTAAAAAAAFRSLARLAVRCGVRLRIMT